MTLAAAAAEELATLEVDTLIASAPPGPLKDYWSTPAIRNQMIAGNKARYLRLFAAITANTKVLPDGSPVLSVPDVVTWAAAATTRINGLATAMSQATISALASANVSGTGKIE